MLHGGIHGGLTADWLFTPFGPAIVTALIRPPPRPPRLGVSGGGHIVHHDSIFGGLAADWLLMPISPAVVAALTRHPPALPSVLGPRGGPHRAPRRHLRRADGGLAPRALRPGHRGGPHQAPPRASLRAGASGGATSCSAAASTAG